jgi:hypothetical protein
MRGIPGTFTDSREAWEREDPVAQPEKGQGHEGSVEAVLALAFPGSTLCRVRQPHER